MVHEPERVFCARIMHVVVHLKYRTIGLGQRLVRETLPRAGTPFVELIAVMAKYNSFAERAGMTKLLSSHQLRRIKEKVDETDFENYSTNISN